MWLIFWPFKAILSVLYIFEVNFFVGFFGFLFGLLGGLVAGYFIFIFSIPLNVPAPEVTKLVSTEGAPLDEKVLKRIIPEIPIWVCNPDYDRADWLNRFLSELWPHVDKAVAKMVKAMVIPMIDQYKPKQIDTIEFQELTLGTLPPNFAGIKVYNTADDEMIIEPVIKWAGNPNIVVAAKAFGLSATVQLVDFTLFAKPRIVLKPLVPVFPCFSRITVSLMEKPTIDFGLKLLGGDLMAIPGLYNFAQETIKNVVSSMMLWPKAYEVYNIEDPIGMKKPVGWLFVRNLHASGLKNLERFGKSDPYVRLTLGEKFGNKHTSVKWNSLNPEWGGEDFQMVVKDPALQFLELGVYDKETGGADKLMGVERVALKDLRPDEPRVFELQLKGNKNELTAAAAAPPPGAGAAAGSVPPVSPTTAKLPKSVGTLYVELMYRGFAPDEDIPLDAAQGNEEKFPDAVPPGGGKLKVIIHNGYQLEGKSHTNPYVKVRFRGEERKTKVLKKTANPDFDEPPFEFYLNAPPLNDVLHVMCFSKNLGITHYVTAKEDLGYVDIQLADVIANGRINDEYQLNNSKQGKLKIEVEWIQKEDKNAKPKTATLEVPAAASELSPGGGGRVAQPVDTAVSPRA